MGYHRYWCREAEIERSVFEKIVLDFERLTLPLKDAGARLAGFDGRGQQEINHSHIVFNGIEKMRASGKP